MTHRKYFHLQVNDMSTKISTPLNYTEECKTNTKQPSLTKLNTKNAEIERLYYTVLMCYTARCC